MDWTLEEEAGAMGELIPAIFVEDFIVMNEIDATIEFTVDANGATNDWLQSAHDPSVA